LGVVRSACSCGFCLPKRGSRLFCEMQIASSFPRHGIPTDPYGSAPNAVFHLRTTRAKCQHPKNPIAARLANAPKTPTGRSTLTYKTVTVLASIVCGFRSFSAR
jgi:hypothetical protein